jgi:hypothetical protein
MAMKMVGAFVLLVVLGLALALGALALDGDRLVPCGSRRGLDAAFGDQFGHVDGPAGGGGCVVPSSPSWALAGFALALPPVVGVAYFSRRKRPEPRSGRTGRIA